ncbi:MAG: MFS transporter [Proteobacteria bacterium]|nr:MAG: MFS transporter [Pseudomonadota bacterium]
MKNISASRLSLWKQPGLGLLGLLTLINLFNYLDRYILVALSPSIQKEFKLDDAQVGLLATAFIYSYLLIAPIFGWLGDRKPRLKLMSVGVGLWSLATWFSGLSKGFGSLMLARAGVGVGEAAYGAISPSVISDLYPKTLRGRCFAIFFMAIPVGSALGFLLGGFLEERVGWRHAFWIAGIPGLAMAVALLFAKDPVRGAFDEPEETREAPAKFLPVLKDLWGNRSFLFTTLGYTAYTFVVGGVAYWIPHYIERYLNVPASRGSMAFGVVTVTAGILGTVVGGVWSDKWARRSPDAFLKLSALSMLASLPVFALVLWAPTFGSFLALVFVLEFLLFLSTSPVNAQTVNSVSPSIRAMANAVSIFSIHLLGDGISPYIVGEISKSSNLLNGMYIFFGALVLAAIFWGLKPILFWESAPWPETALKLPEVQVHRGLELNGVQENTLAAFRAAAAAGAKMVELDVHLSKDKIPVVVHDKTIQRIAGRPGIVAEMTAAELKAAAQVPTLEEVFTDAGCKNLLVNVELKSDTAREAGMEKAIATVVARTGVQGRILFSSFNPLSLRRLAKLLPDVPRALLATGENEPANKFYLRRMLLAWLARPHMLNYDGRYLTESMVRSLHSRRVPFAVWTVADPQDAKKFLALGAKSIISPLPNIVG